MEEHINAAFLIPDGQGGDEALLETAQALKPIQRQFMDSYLAHREKMPLADWLQTELANNLPTCSPQETAEMSQEILSTLQLQEEKRASLEQARSDGRSAESWFAGQMKAATAHAETQQAAQYLQGLDDALNQANRALADTIYTKAGLVSQNPSLDGFIAEQYHAQTFNLNAKAAGSPYRAKVLTPQGGRYGKNSVDIVITDGAGKIVRRYQVKYYQDAQATAQAFRDGNYPFQSRLVPVDQAGDIPGKAAAVLEAPDGTTSTPLSKARAKQLQEEAQSGQWNDLNWNEYSLKDLSLGIGRQAGQAALLGAAIGAGFEVAQKVWNGEEIDGQELVENALTTGADFGVKAAAAGALKVGVEKGVVGGIPKGTPAGTIANIVFVAAENVKVAGKIATGELTVREGLEEMEQTTVSAVAGIAAGTQGAEIGAAVGTLLGPAGTVVGGLVGGAIGYMAGSKVGEAVVKGVQKVRQAARDVVESVADAAREAAGAVVSGIGSALSGIASLFGF